MNSSGPPERALERRIVSILFADLVGFTSFADRLDVEDVAAVQDAYFAAVRETVGRYGGRLEKFIGDAAMAVFGIPRAREDDAERAVRAALALTSAVEQVQTRFGLDEPGLQVRVGVNTGEVVTGGPDALATGDTVNVAARFQAAANAGTVVVGEATALSVEDAIELAPLEPLELKGKSNRIAAWRATALRPQRSRDHAMGRLHAPLLGRDADLRFLEQALAAGRGRVVLIAPPGIGKTRLTSEFVDRLEIPVLRAKLRPDVLAPYHPVAQLVSGALVAAGVEVDEAAAREALAERLSTTAGRKAVVTDAIVSVIWPATAVESTRRGAADRDALFEAWLEGFDALTPGPVVWLVDDVHWAGGDLLAFLAAAAGREDTVILATTRPALLDNAHDWCERGNLHHLPPLSLGDAVELVRALVGDALPSEVSARIADRSDGNPLFIEELLRTWISVGILRVDDGGFAYDAEGAEISLPTTVQAIYAAQIDDLPEKARAVVRQASVAGRRFPDHALAALELSDASTGVAVLERRALISEGPVDGLLGPTHVFRHALLRDAGYATLSRSDRAQLHVRLARWLEQAAAGRWASVAELVGQHYATAVEAAPRFATELGLGVDRAEGAQLAALWFERAAATALDVAAHDAAQSLLRRALVLTEEAALADRARRLELLGRATAFAADMAEGAEATAAALEIYRRLGDAERTAWAAHALGMIELQQLRFQDAYDLANAMLKELDGVVEREVAALYALRAAASYALTNELGRSEPDTRAALAVARAAGDQRLELAALEWSVAFHSPEPAHLESVDIDRTVCLADRAGHWTTVAAAHESRALLLVMTDRPAEATAAITQVDDVATTHGVTEALAWSDYLRCEQGLLTGDWEDAIEAGLRAIELTDRNGYARAGIRTWMALGALAHARDERTVLDELRAWHETRRPLLSRVPSPFARLMFEAQAVRLRDAGMPMDRLIDQPPLPQTFAVPFRQPAWFAGADVVFTSLIDESEASEAEAALAHFAVRNREWSSSMSLAFEDLLRARLVAAQAGGFQSHAERALERFRSITAPWWEAKALRLLGLDANAEAIEKRLGITSDAR